MNDLETLLQGIITFLKANLDGAIDAINTKKADAITLEKPVDASYCLQFLQDKALNQDSPIFVIVCADSPDTQQMAQSIKESHSIWILIGMERDPNVADDDDNHIRLLRYRQVLKTLLAANWNKIINGVQFKIEIGPPSEGIYDNKNVFVVGASLQNEKGV